MLSGGTKFNLFTYPPEKAQGVLSPIPPLYPLLYVYTFMYTSMNEYVPLISKEFTSRTSVARVISASLKYELELIKRKLAKIKNKEISFHKQGCFKLFY